MALMSHAFTWSDHIFAAAMATTTNITTTTTTTTTTTAAVPEDRWVGGCVPCNVDR